jgi:hypothetical protein
MGPTLPMHILFELSSSRFSTIFHLKIGTKFAARASRGRNADKPYDFLCNIIIGTVVRSHFESNILWNETLRCKAERSL